MRKVIIVLAAVSVLFGISLANEPVYPNYTGFVNDYAGVLDPGTREKLEGLCKTLEQKTSAELAIAIVKSVAPIESKEYAVKLFEKWKIGKKGKDNGLLILLAMDERRVEIEVGYGLEGVVNDAKAGEILDEYVVPFFKEGKFGEGLYNGAAAIAERIAENAKQEMGDEYKAKTADTTGGFLAFIIVSVIALVILSFFASGIASGAFGALFGAIFGFSFAGMIGAIIGAVIGFVISYIKGPGSGSWSGGGWSGGSFGGGGGGGGGGSSFGGGSSGGGGAGRSW